MPQFHVTKKMIDLFKSRGFSRDLNGSIFRWENTALSLFKNTDNPAVWRLYEIKTDWGLRQKGSGTRALAALCQLADETHHAIELTAFTYPNGMPQEKLVQWYKAHQFAVSDGNDMVRLPQQRFDFIDRLGLGLPDNQNRFNHGHAFVEMSLSGNVWIVDYLALRKGWTNNGEIEAVINRIATTSSKLKECVKISDSGLCVFTHLPRNGQTYRLICRRKGLNYTTVIGRQYAREIEDFVRTWFQESRQCVEMWKH